MQEVSDKNSGQIDAKNYEEIEGVRLNAEGLVLYTPTKTRKGKLAGFGGIVDDGFMGTDGKVHHEPQRAKRAFEDYVRMGTGRSIEKLAREYIKPEYQEWTANFNHVNHKLLEYSSRYDWQDRLRTLKTQASAQALASAQREAVTNTRGRIKLAQKAQLAGISIIEKANLEGLDEEGARSLMKTAGALLRIGLDSERAEMGDNLAVIRPNKPIREMTDEELDEYASVLQKTLT